MPLDAARALRLLAELRDIDYAARARKSISLAEKQRRLAIARELNGWALDSQKLPSGQNQRLHPRAPVKLRAEILGGPRAMEVQSDSLAVGGMSVSLPFAVRVADLLALRLIPAPPDEPFEVMAEVIWFHPVRMRAGLRFHELGEEGLGVIERIIFSDLVAQNQR